MPSSTRRGLRDVRRAFTGEDKATAEAGVGRNDLGLDSCTPEQRRFRALLALHLFNPDLRDTDSGGSYVYCAYAFLSYTMTVSPRHDHLVFIIPPAVENALGRLMAESHDLQHGVPGLRLVAAHDFYAYHVVHLPTGARMVLARRPNFASKAHISRLGSSVGGWSTKTFPGLDTPLGQVEQVALAAMPPMTGEAETLLAALVSRLDARDPAGRWAVNNWWGDPLHRPKPPGYHDGANRVLMSLWGSGADWQLRWCRHPYPEDLIACLTAPVIGVRGATAIKHGQDWRITLGESSLLLRYGGV